MALCTHIMHSVLFLLDEYNEKLQELRGSKEWKEHKNLQNYLNQTWFDGNTPKVCNYYNIIIVIVLLSYNMLSYASRDGYAAIEIPGCCVL